MSEPVFVLFANCIPVRGARRSTLCDLQTGRMKLIPNSLFELLTQHPKVTASQAKAAYENQYDEEIDEYYQFLADQGWGFWCDEPEAFPDLDLAFEVPERVNHAIIDSDQNSNHDFPQILEQLMGLGCKFFQFRFYAPTPRASLETILHKIENRRVAGVEFLLPYSPAYQDEAALLQWMKAYPRIISLTLTGASQTKQSGALEHVSSMGRLIYTVDRVDSSNCCGQVDPDYFAVNIKSFTEATHYNSCLNRKISLDTKGNIRNCPSMKKSFGNLADTSFEEALEATGFRDIWSLTKDQVTVCKDCEFRRVCSDCRAFTTNDDPYGKPSRCTYDPYTATWRQPEETSMEV